MIDTVMLNAAAVSLVILAVLILRGLVGRHFGPQAAYALWLAPLIRALWPFVPSLDIRPQFANGTSGVAMTMIVTQMPSISEDWFVPWLAIAWAAGALGYLAVELFRHIRFVRKALASAAVVPSPEISYEVIASEAVAGPLATGLINPIILVPADFTERFTPEQQRLALLHEQTHLRRGDIWASAAALAVTAALWFNPFAHVALRAFRRDMEAACDFAVLANSDPAEASTYAETIMRCATRPVPRSLCAFTSIDELKGRLKMLTLNHSPARRAFGFLFAAAVCTTGLALSGRALADEPKKTEIIEKRIIQKGGPGDQDFLKHVDSDDPHAFTKECPGEKVEITADGGSSDKKQQVKLFICGERGAGSGGLADALTKALGQMDEDNANMDPAIKAELKAKIEAKIAELRAKG